VGFLKNKANAASVKSSSDARAGLLGVVWVAALAERLTGV
jgi:hypothetical protein